MRVVPSLISGLCFCAISLSALASSGATQGAKKSNPENDHIYESCVGTCKGTFCDEAFADIEFAIEFIDAAEDDCERNGSGIN